jgi:hypothetical protein
MISDYLIIPPNWAERVFQRRKWKTSIQTSINGLEKRSQLYSWPRKALRYTALCLDMEESNYLRRKIRKNLSNIIGVPVWSEEVKLSSIAPMDQNVLNVVSTAHAQFEVGGYCLITNKYNTYEKKQIYSVTETSIVVEENLVLTWAQNNYVYPLLICTINPTQNIMSEVAGYDKIQFEYNEIFEYDRLNEVDHFVFSDPSYVEYKGYPVFTVKPNWGTAVNVDSINLYEELEYLGPKEIDSTFSETDWVFSASFLNLSNSELLEILQFFDMCRGRLNPFWFPTFNHDIQVTEGFNSTDTVLTINDVDWESDWGINQIVGKYLCFSFPDETEVYRKIVSAPSSTSIELNAAIGVTLSSNLKNLKVSFLIFGRFDLDEIEYGRITNTACEMQLKFKSIYHESILT